MWRSPSIGMERLKSDRKDLDELWYMRSLLMHGEIFQLCSKSEKIMKGILSEELHSLLHALPVCLPEKQQYFMLPITRPSPFPTIYFNPLLRKSRNLTFRTVIMKHDRTKTIVFLNHETSSSHRRDHAFHSKPFANSTCRIRITLIPKMCLHQKRHILRRTKPISELISLSTFL